ncbi:MAG: hypothetical protein ACK5Q5_09270 [Planctomycetaceae bacterium]
MSDELKFPVDTELDACCGEEFEEITSEEVDRIVAALDDLMESTDSQNIRALLEEAATNIYCLVYDAEDEDDVADAA